MTQNLPTSTALVGIRPCGCITAVMLEGFADTAETAEFYADMVATGRKVSRMDFDVAKATEHFLDCPHKDEPHPADLLARVDG